MNIIFSPVKSDLWRLKGVAVSGDTITVAWQDELGGGRETLDLSMVTEGAELPADAISINGVVPWWVQGVITRTDGVLRICLRLPHAARAPEAARFPSPVTLVAGDVVLPDCDGPHIPGPVMTSMALPDPYDPNQP